MKQEDIIQKWDDAADAWIDLPDRNEWRRHFQLPFVSDLLGDVGNATILDIGCGEGEYARVLSKKGAIVLGIDSSPRLIEAANAHKRPGEGNLAFRVGDASNLESIEDGSFDICLSMMCFMAIPKFREAVEELARILKPNGRAILTTLHPCFTGPHARVRPDENTDFYTNDHYFSEEWFEDNLSEGIKASLPFLHRTLENLIMPFLNSGLALQGLFEPNPTDEQLTAFPGMAPLRRIPHFIALEFRRNP